MNRNESPREKRRAINSLSPDDEGTQPNGPNPNSSRVGPQAHVVLYQPEIPQNTGNIGRTCVATDSKLWLVRPLGFQLDNKRLSRAGLDYWPHLELGDARNWEDLQAQLGQEQPSYRMFYLSRFAEREIWEADFQLGDVFVFGSESSGLPEQILRHEDPCALRLPTSERVRSLNLATTVGVVLFEQQRQLRKNQASATGTV